MLGSAVGVLQQPWERAAQTDRHVQGREHQTAIHPLLHRSADGVARKQIDDRRYVQPALVGGHVGDVGDPTAIRCRGGEILLEQVRRDRMMIV